MITDIEASNIMEKASRLVTIWSPWWLKYINKVNFVYSDKYSKITGLSSMIFQVDTKFLEESSIMEVAVALEFALQQSSRRMDVRVHSMKRSNKRASDEMVTLACSLEINSDMELKFSHLNAITWRNLVKRHISEEFISQYGANDIPSLPQGAWTYKDFGFPPELRAENYLKLLLEKDEELEKEWLKNKDKENQSQEGQEDQDQEDDTSNSSQDEKSKGVEQSKDGQGPNANTKNGAEDTTRGDDSENSAQDNSLGNPNSTPEYSSGEEKSNDNDSSLEDNSASNNASETSKEKGESSTHKETNSALEGDTEGVNDDNLDSVIEDQFDDYASEKPQDGNENDLSGDTPGNDAGADNSSGGNAEASSQSGGLAGHENGANTAPANDNSISPQEGGNLGSQGENNSNSTSPNEDNGLEDKSSQEDTSGRDDTADVRETNSSEDGSDSGDSSKVETPSNSSSGDGASSNSNSGDGISSNQGSPQTKKDVIDSIPQRDKFKSLEDVIKELSDKDGRHELTLPEKDKELDSVHGANEMEKENISKELAQDMMDFHNGNFGESLGAGGVGLSDKYVDWATAKLRKPRASWKKVLPKMLTAVTARSMASGMTDMSFSKRNPNQQKDMPLMMGFITYPPSVNIVIDASPSMAHEKSKVISDFVGIATHFFIQYGEPVGVIVADNNVKFYKKVLSVSQQTLRVISRTYLGGSNGSGANDGFGDTIKKLMNGRAHFMGKKIPPSDILVIFTDCGFDFPYENYGRLPSSAPYIIIVSPIPYDQLKNSHFVNLPRWVKNKKNFVSIY